MRSLHVGAYVECFYLYVGVCVCVLHRRRAKKKKLEPIESPLTDLSDSNATPVRCVGDTRLDPTEKRKKMSKHEAVDGEEGDISTDSDRVTLMLGENEDEHKTLVNTCESFEEELPYVPTTLPLER